MKNVARVFSGFQTYSERCRSGAGEAWQGRRVDVGLKSAAEWDISAMPFRRWTFRRWTDFRWRSLLPNLFAYTECQPCSIALGKFILLAGFFKENVRYPVWTCRDPISLILGTRWWFSLILGTRF